MNFSERLDVVLHEEMGRLDTATKLKELESKLKEMLDKGELDSKKLEQLKEKIKDLRERFVSDRDKKRSPLYYTSRGLGGIWNAILDTGSRRYG